MDTKNSYLLPVVIVLAGILIGGALFYVRSTNTVPSEGDISLLRPISTNDHIVGNPGASVVIVEYSDIDCPYCKNFQESMEQVMTDYGPSGNVAWVYRHFPVIEAHPNSAAHAEAAECVASLGGDDLFFRFIDALHQAAPGDAQFDPKGYAAIITTLGLSLPDFESCVAGSKFEKRVADDFDNALAVGAVGAPFSVILIKGHNPVPVSGYLPYDSLKQVIDASIARSAEPSEN